MKIFEEGRSLEEGFREGQFNYQNFSGEADETKAVLDGTFYIDAGYRKMIADWVMRFICHERHKSRSRRVGTR